MSCLDLSSGCAKCIRASEAIMANSIKNFTYVIALIVCLAEISPVWFVVWRFNDSRVFKHNLFYSYSDINCLHGEGCFMIWHSCAYYLGGFMYG